MARILLIDDERPTLDMLSLFLSGYGHEAMTAENGETGLEVYTRERPDIVITDIKMPGMDGLEVLKRIKTLDPATEVIVVTGHGDMDIAIQALNLNATDFINKPVKKDALESALRRAEERIARAREGADDVLVRLDASMAVLDVRGNITSRSETGLVDAFNKVAALGAAGILMRFEENATINGAGIVVLTQLLQGACKKDKRVAVTGLSDNFRKVFDVVGISRVAKICDSEVEAQAHLSA
ncbi:MAG: response regulator [Desulfovibrionaceae bacterium]